MQSEVCLLKFKIIDFPGYMKSRFVGKNYTVR